MKSRAALLPLLAAVACSALPGCGGDDFILEHADRAPRRYNTEYMSVGDFFDHLPLIAHGDTVMICGYRVNSKPMYLDRVGLTLSKNGDDTVYHIYNHSIGDGVVPVFITNKDEGEGYMTHGTSDLWLIEECMVYFGTEIITSGHADYVKLYCPSGKYVHSIPQN